MFFSFFADIGTIMSIHCLQGGVSPSSDTIWSRVLSSSFDFILSILFAARIGLSFNSRKNLNSSIETGI